MSNLMHLCSNARHGGGTVIPYLNFSIPCAALEPIFKFSEGNLSLSPSFTIVILHSISCLVFELIVSENTKFILYDIYKLQIKREYGNNTVTKWYTLIHLFLMSWVGYL